MYKTPKSSRKKRIARRIFLTRLTHSSKLYSLGDFENYNNNNNLVRK